MKITHKILLMMIIGLVSFSGYGQINHEVLIPPSEYTLKKIELADSNIYSRLKLVGANRTKQPGAPCLPVKYINLIVPPRSKITGVTLQQVQKSSVKLEKIIEPVQYPVPTTITHESKGFVPPDSAIYNSNKPYPDKKIEIVEQGHARGNKIVTVAVYPFVYIPRENLLNVYSSLKIRLDYEIEPARKVESFRRSNNLTSDRALLKSMVDNDDDIEEYNVWKNYTTSMNDTSDQANTQTMGTLSVDVGYEYVIITTQSLSSAFDDFIAWKKRKGIDIGLVTVKDIVNNYNGDQVSGIYDNAGSIRQYLKDAYINGLEYALLGGDATVVPIRYGTGANDTWTSNPDNPGDYKIPADLYYSDLDGDWHDDGDNYYGEPEDDVETDPEVFVGRLLCSNSSEIQNWIGKVLKYEKNPGNGDNAYLEKAFYTQADEMQRDGEAVDIANEFMSVFPQWTVYSEKYNGSNDWDSPGTPQFPSGNDVIGKLNEHWGMVGWFNHGKPQAIAMATPGANECFDQGKHKIVFKDSHDGGCEVPDNDGNGFDDLTNTNHPSVVYTISCETNPFDDFRHSSDLKNMGEAFTVMTQAGGPIYLGNTRYGWVGSSKDLFSKFIEAVINANIYHFGQAEAISKHNDNSHYLRLSHNLIGCPETELWTDVPSEFTGVTITESSGDVTVKTGGISDCNICVMTSDDGGSAYWDTVSNVSSHTFSNVPKPYYVTVTKHNYLPYMEEVTCPNAITGSGPVCTSGKTFSLDLDMPDGSVTWSNSGNLSYISGQGTDTYSVEATSSSTSGAGWIEATTSGGCGSVPRKNVWVGLPDQPEWDPGELGEVQANVPNVACVSGESDGASSYNWGIDGGYIDEGQGTECLTFVPYCTWSLGLNVEGVNACGDGPTIFQRADVICMHPEGTLTLMPNPSDDMVTVTVEEQPGEADSSDCK